MYVHTQVDPETGTVLKHVDTWDSIRHNQWLSIEGLIYVVRSLADVHLLPDVEQPKYTVSSGDGGAGDLCVSEWVSE